jgi:hypothetical protein
MFRMNEYHHPIDIQQATSTYSLNATNIKIASLAVYFLVGSRSIAEFCSDGIGRLESMPFYQNDDIASVPIHVRCDWENGVIFVIWSKNSIPDHEIVCSYEFYIKETAPIRVNWSKEGF